MKSALIILFLLMCVSQWLVPISLIAEQESALRQGREFRFRTAPVDPSDPFRGKYITLNFEDETFKYTGQQHWERGQLVFVIVAPDEEGFARIKDVVVDKPVAGEDFFQAEVQYSSPGSLTLEFPFNRFYLEESKAAEAEQTYWRTRSDTTQVAYAVVKLKNGTAVLSDVMINDRSIVEIVREMNLKGGE